MTRRDAIVRMSRQGAGVVLCAAVVANAISFWSKHIEGSEHIEERPR